MSHQEYLKSIGMELRIARIRKGYSQTALAKKTGMSAAAVCDVETGRTDSKILTFKRIADVLEVQMKDIL